MLFGGVVIAVGLGSGVGVLVAVAIGVSVAVGGGVLVAVAVGVLVAVGNGVLVAVAVGVAVLLPPPSSNSICNNGAPEASPLKDSAQRVPVPVTINARELPYAQPERLTIS